MRYMYTFSLKMKKKMTVLFAKVYDQEFKKKEHHFYSLFYSHFKAVCKQMESEEDYNPARDLKYDTYSSRFYTMFIDYLNKLNQIDTPWSEFTF